MYPQKAANTPQNFKLHLVSQATFEIGEEHVVLQFVVLQLCEYKCSLTCFKRAEISQLCG